MSIKRILIDLLFIGVPAFAVAGIYNIYLNEIKAEYLLTSEMLEDSRNAHLFSEQMYLNNLIDIECSIKYIQNNDKQLLLESIETYRKILRDKLSSKNISDDDKAAIRVALKYESSECI